MRAGFSRCLQRSQKCFGTTGTRACAKAGRRCRRCHRDRNPKTRCERAIVRDDRLRTNEVLRPASRRFLRFRFVLRERKAGEAGTKPDGGSPQAPQPRLSRELEAARRVLKALGELLTEACREADNPIRLG